MKRSENKTNRTEQPNAVELNEWQWTRMRYKVRPRNNHKKYTSRLQIDTKNKTGRKLEPFKKC